MNRIFFVHIIAAFFLVGCGAESELKIDDGIVSVPMPERLRQASAIDTSNLILEVSVNGGAAATARNQSGSEWTTQVDVPTDNVDPNVITVRWLANVGGSQIMLADFVSTIGSEQDVLTVEGYNEDFDEDFDGRTNLLELSENRNPLDRIDLVIPFTNATFLPTSIGFRELNRSTDESEDRASLGNETEESAFSVWHDGQSLNFLVCVQDSVVSEDSVIFENGRFLNYWHDDGVEIYIDAGNNAVEGNNFDTQDDFQFVYNPGQNASQVQLSNNSGDRPICPMGSCSSHRFLDTVNCAYELSVEYDLQALGLSSGSEFGLDVEITDDDNNGLRDRKYAWIGVENDSFISPFTFGKVRLE